MGRILGFGRARLTGAAIGRNTMEEAFVGIDVAFAKKKRLPIVACRRRDGVLEPLQLRRAVAKPPRVRNAKALDATVVARFAEATVAYLCDIERENSIRIGRIAIDSPSAPRPPGALRRRAEVALDERRISCITTPDVNQFVRICDRARLHLSRGGRESDLPGANQLWMLVGFALFAALGKHWDCPGGIPPGDCCCDQVERSPQIQI